MVARQPPRSPPPLTGEKYLAAHEEDKRRGGLIAGVAFVAVETGIESAAGIWGYLFLSSGRGLSPAAAGIAVSAYWAMMFVGRALLGWVAERLGPSRLLTGAVACVPLGALLMATQPPPSACRSPRPPSAAPRYRPASG